MKSKYVFILLLLALLVFTVIKMMQFETSLREEKQIKLFIEDESKPLLSKIPDDELKEAAARSDYYFTASGNYFNALTEYYQDEYKIRKWEELFLKGVNLGVAVPGKFPAEFSLNFDQYLRWIRLIGEMNANVIRIYTILPPEFYEAFAYYNLHHSDKPVFLIQGVWTEVPADENYYDPDFVREFQKEMIDAIDVIHGRAVLREKPGKASGVYSMDVSRNVAALLLGREWEPGGVYKTNQVNAIKQYNGDFVCMNDGNAMEAWLARMMDFAVLYETQQYHFQHPVSFVNWLPLDPLYHNTEIIENSRVREYDNDLESIDLSKFHATGLFYPGIYAAYHAYPYYPDFVYLQDSYVNNPGQDSARGPYFNYLRDLKNHTPGMPLIIAEYGLPSSRGNSHFSPFGFHQGGHSEQDHADLSLQMTTDIVESTCAGAIYFEWIDEWFKHNWLVMDFEIPEDNRKLWHNMENPEQNFGILALEDKKKAIDADLNDWPGFKTTAGNMNLAFDADASYFYIVAHLPGFDFSRDNLFLAIDTYNKEKGDHKLPFSEKIFDHGFEFLVECKSADSSYILVDEPYSVYTDIYNNYIPVYASKRNADGVFIHQYMLTNRSRVSLTGEKTDSILIDRSHLLFGKSTDPRFSNADWYYDDQTGILEMRIDWHLLNVSDPSKRYVLDDREGTKVIEYTETDGFHIGAFITDKEDRMISAYPENSLLSYAWETWDVPDFTERLKPVYYTLKDYFRDLSFYEDDGAATGIAGPAFNITDYYLNKEGAISISFDNASFSQYQYGLPVIKKYRISATFGIIPELLDNTPGVMALEGDAMMKRLSIREVREMAIDQDIALQPLPGTGVDKDDLYLLGEKTESQVESIHSDKSDLIRRTSTAAVFARPLSPTGITPSVFNGMEFIQANGNISQSRMDDLLKSRKNKWTIFVYHHLIDNEAEIPHQISEKEIAELFTQRADFEQQVRLMRNSDYWIAPETAVFKYLKEKKESTIITDSYKNLIFLRVTNRLDENIYDQPLTIEYRSDARIIRIEGSVSDGTFNNRQGVFHFNALPNKEIIIEIIE